MDLSTKEFYNSIENSNTYNYKIIDHFIFFLNQNLFLKSLIKWFLSIFNIFKISNLFFCILILLNGFFLLFFYLKKKNNSVKILRNQEINILFILFLSLSGLIQSFINYEIFKIINFSLGLLISFFYLLYESEFKLFFYKNIRFFMLILLAYIFALFYKFPNNSTVFNYENYNNKDYSVLNNNFFSNNKKIINRSYEYYKNVSAIICPKNKFIYNFSGDFSLAYLCNNLKNKLSTKHGFALKNINASEYQRIFIQNNIDFDEILITRFPINSLNLLAKFISPHVPKYWYGDIYIYEKKG